MAAGDDTDSNKIGWIEHRPRRNNQARPWASRTDWGARSSIVDRPGPAHPEATDSELFMVGAHCAECRTLDYLPVTCNDCGKAFCHSHGVSHSCAAARTSQASPAAQPPGPESTDKTPKKSAKLPKRRCPVKGCKESLGLLAIECRACRGLFCSKHRFDSDHHCTGRGSAASNSRLLTTPHRTIAGVAA